MSTTSQVDAHPSSKADRWRVAGATIVGTTIEWYDFFIYAQAAAIIFNPLFFEPMTKGDPNTGQLLSFFTIGLSFLFRPLGAVLVGHFGDKVGRKAMLVITLVLMGAATTLIGVLPDYHSLGIWAPLLLMLLRILQGISAGGEWGGAVLMAVEHAPVDKRGRYGMFPQLGVPIGMLLATGVLALMSGVIAPGEAFQQWGWRVPFLFSVVLIVVGFIVRQSVDESPVFKEMAESGREKRMPLLALLKRHWALVIALALVFAGNNATGYMITGGFILGHSTNKNLVPELYGVEALAKPDVLNAVTIAAFVWFLATLLSGYMADWIGRKTTFVIGFLWMIVLTFPLFFFVRAGIETNQSWLLIIGMSLMAVGLGLTYGPQSAWYAESFPASVRTSGVSISYALGAILGGAFSPLIAAALVEQWGTTLAVSTYLTVMTVIGLTAALIVRDRQGIPMSIEFEESGHYHLWDARKRPAWTESIGVSQKE